MLGLALRQHASHEVGKTKAKEEREGVEEQLVFASMFNRPSHSLAPPQAPGVHRARQRGRDIGAVLFCTHVAPHKKRKITLPPPPPLTGPAAGAKDLHARQGRGQEANNQNHSAEAC